MPSDPLGLGGEMSFPDMLSLICIVEFLVGLFVFYLQLLSSSFAACELLVAACGI